MEDAELERISQSLGNAQTPEEVFGKFAGTQTEVLEAARKVFRQMAKAVHPDTYQGTSDYHKADATFKKLAQFWELAQVKIAAGSYGTTGKTFEPFIIRTKVRSYTIEKLLSRGDICNLYMGTYLLADEKTQGILKVPVKPGDNDLVTNEARILRQLQAGEGYGKLRHFVSQLVDAFSYQEKESGTLRQVNVLSYVKGLYSLQEVKKAYPQGVDPRDVAWIWRRLLIALGFAHTNKVIHGAVLPTHVMLHPAQHGVVLIDWSYAVFDPSTTDERISAISTSYREWYPAEVFAREEATRGLDIYMAAKCMIDLLGGDPHKRTMPASVPWQIQNYLKGCTLAKPQQRPQDAYVLLEEFDKLLERLWGARKFHQFTMPEH